MKTPKDLLLENTVLTNEIKDALENPAITRAMHIAFAQYCLGLPGGENPQRAWDANNRRQGAVEFMRTLTSIADKTIEHKTTNIPQLNPV
jgi:hypothetical protein